MSETLFAILRADRAARTAHQHHGSGVLTFFDGKPMRASGCLLPNGAAVEAVCLANRDDIEVWSRAIEGTHLRRRGRLIVEPGSALHFVDEPEADLPPETSAVRPDLSRDLALCARIRTRVQSDVFAGLLYAALCSNEWRHAQDNETWSCSRRTAGDIVAGLRGAGDYLDWYCWGQEGTIDEIVLAEIEALGWHPASLETAS